jgi:hypothetical protein
MLERSGVTSTWRAVSTATAGGAHSEGQPMSYNDPLLAPIPGADHRLLNGVQLDIVQTGSGRVKRTIYEPGFRWSTHMKSIAHTDLCMHAHVGFLARGRVHVEYADGCVHEFTAPQAVYIEPGHEGWVVGDQAAVLIEVDFEGETASRFGMPETHRHL